MAYVQARNPVKITSCGRRRSKVAGNSPFTKDNKLDKQIKDYNDIQYFYKGTKNSGKIPILDQVNIT